MSKEAIKQEREYWDCRYREALPSGGRTFIDEEWDLINRFVYELGVVTDIGCGDLRFWEGRWDKVDVYQGLDISKEIIERNRANKIVGKQTFICAPAEEYCAALEAHTVFCLNTLFHIMDAENFHKILDNICRYAKRYLILSAWMKNPFLEGDSDGVYQKYVPFDANFVLSHGFEGVIYMRQVSLGSTQNVVNSENVLDLKEHNLKNRIDKGFYIFRRVQ